MHGYVKRMQEEKLHKALSRSPAVAILGPRQSGKSNNRQNRLQAASPMLT
ncbi:hypothetical protein KKHLCK_12770 [Candidatus Electrothrix laxa]